MKVVVYHRSYGCDTGCCGHAIEVDGEESPGSFEFEHPWTGHESYRDWAERFVADQLGEEHVKDLDWEHCLVTDD
jgi:hypothetical protein